MTTAPHPLERLTVGRFRALLEEAFGTWNLCTECQEYLAVRDRVLERELRLEAIAQGVPRSVLFRRLMRGVHERHLRGVPILPGPQHD